jgi:citrate lyase subunit beta/citryl-CoA lyase
LFVPVDNPRFVGAAWTRNADEILLDLEDSVSEPRKAYARGLVKEAIAEVAKGGALVTVRINHDYWAADLEAAVWPGLAGIMYPKVESAEQVRQIDAKISELERRRGIQPGTIEINLSVFAETVRGVVHAYAIAGASRRIRIFGGGSMGFDLCRDLAVEAVAEAKRATECYALGECDLVARVLELEPGNGVHAPGSGGVAGDVVSDAPGLAGALANRRAGLYSVGICLHPNRVAAQNRGYTPSSEEVAAAQRLNAFFEEMDSRGETEGTLEGRAVDRWEAARARQLVEWAENCARQERAKARARARAEAPDRAAATP